MSHASPHGDDVPDNIRQELIVAIEADRCVIPRPVLASAFDYAQRHLSMDHPTEFMLWEYIVGRLQILGRWRYARLDEYYPSMGYALRRADGRRLYIKLRFNDQSRVELMSFHD